jgi:hypothetical protein
VKIRLTITPDEYDKGVAALERSFDLTEVSDFRLSRSSQGNPRRAPWGYVYAEGQPKSPDTSTNR